MLEKTSDYLPVFLSKMAEPLLLQFSTMEKSDTCHEKFLF